MNWLVVNDLLNGGHLCLRCKGEANAGYGIGGLKNSIAK